MDDWQTRERLAVLETQFDEMQRQHVDMASDVKKILAALNEAKGGWRVMLLLGGSAGVLGAFVGKWLAIVVNGMPK